MALQLQQVAVAAAPTVTPLGNYPGPGCLVLTNPGAAAVFVGGPNVTVGSGFPVPAGQSCPFPVMGNAGQLYAIAAAAAVLGVGYGTAIQ